MIIEDESLAVIHRAVQADDLRCLRFREHEGKDLELLIKSLPPTLNMLAAIEEMKLELRRRRAARN